MPLTPSQIAFEAALKSGAASGVHPVLRSRLEWSAAVERKQEAAYRSFLKDTGLLSTPDDFISTVEKQEKTLALAHKVAQRLESLGLPGYREGGSQVWLFGPHSGRWELLPDFARNNFNPWVAHQKRNGILRELEFYLQKHGKACRMAVVTGGDHGSGRVTIDKVADQWDWQNRKIREWNKSQAARFFGCEVVFRSNEAGSIFRKEAHKTRDEKGRFVRQYMRDARGQRIRNVDEDGKQTLHPHTHFIYRMSRFLTPREWKQFIAAMQKHFEQAMPDHGAIADAREACKYVLKSDEVLHFHDSDLLDFYHITYRRHLVQPMAALKAQKRHHEANMLKLRRVRTGKEGEGSELRPVINWNRKPLAFQKSEIEALTEPARDTTLCARLAPMSRFSPVAEPLFLFRGRVDLKAAYRCGHVQAAMHATKDAYEAAEQLFHALHGTTPAEWATTVAPLLAASRKVSAHTSPVTGASGTEKAGAVEERGLSLFGGDPAGGEKQNQSKKPAVISSGRGTEKPRHRSELGLSLFGELQQCKNP